MSPTMNSTAFVSSILLLLLLSFAGCKDHTSPNGDGNVEVTVKVSTTDYDQNTFRQLFPDSISLHNISFAFNNNYSEERRNGLVVNMLVKVSARGEDAIIMDTMLTRAGCRTPGEYVLPTYAERAKYSGRKAWLVQFTYGLGVPTFGRYKCFAFSIPDLDTLNYVAAR
jgi:hypothetical protein